jgi:hypothetical protein
MARFEANPPGAIQYAAVPWPPDPALMLRAMVALEGGSEKRVFRKLSMRWHPDKFQSRCAPFDAHEPLRRIALGHGFWSTSVRESVQWSLYWNALFATATRRYGSGLAAADSERILTHVKDISQVLNLAWDAKEF